MGRASQFYWFLNFEELPPKFERDFIFTSLDVESDEMKRIRRVYRAGLRKARKEEEGQEVFQWGK